MQITMIPKKLPLLALTLLAPGVLWAQSFSGRFTSAFYAYERSDSVDVTSTHARGYQSFQVDVGTRNVKLRTYGQMDTDFATRLAGDGKVRMYNLYLEWKNIARRGEVRLGRQTVFGGVTTGTIDGVQVKVRLASWVQLKGFAGGLLPAHQRVKLIDESGDNYLAGGQAIFTPRYDLDVSLGFFNKRQTRAGFNTLRADSVGNVFTQLIQPSSQAFKFASLDAFWEPTGRSSMYTRLDMDLNGEEFSRVEVSGRTGVTNKLSVNGGYTFRSPRLPWNSIFSVFNVEDNHEVEAGLYFRHSPSLRFFGNGSVIKYTDENSMQFTLGCDVNYGSLSFVRRGGYAGELNGINASAYYPLRGGKVLPSVQGSWASYKLDADDAESQTLLAGAANLRVRLWNAVSADGQVQILTNRHYTNDVRFLFRLQYWFFNRMAD